jgi:hypothetical protein
VVEDGQQEKDLEYLFDWSDTTLCQLQIVSKQCTNDLFDTTWAKPNCTDSNVGKQRAAAAKAAKASMNKNKKNGTATNTKKKNATTNTKKKNATTNTKKNGAATNTKKNNTTKKNKKNKPVPMNAKTAAAKALATVQKPKTRRRN